MEDESGDRAKTIFCDSAVPDQGVSNVLQPIRLTQHVGRRAAFYRVMLLEIRTIEYTQNLDSDLESERNAPDAPAQ